MASVGEERQPLLKPDGDPTALGNTRSAEEGKQGSYFFCTPFVLYFFVR